MRAAVPLLLLASVTVAGADKAPPMWRSFRAYPAAAKLCGPERVHGNNMEIHWDSYTSTAPVAEVVKWYETMHGTKAKKVGKTLEFRDAQNSDLVLTVYPASEQKTMPGCSKTFTADAKTGILVSIAYRHAERK